MSIRKCVQLSRFVVETLKNYDLSPDIFDEPISTVKVVKSRHLHTTQPSDPCVTTSSGMNQTVMRRF